MAFFAQRLGPDMDSKVTQWQLLHSRVAASLIPTYKRSCLTRATD